MTFSVKPYFDGELELEMKEKEIIISLSLSLSLSPQFVENVTRTLFHSLCIRCRGYLNLHGTNTLHTDSENENEI